MSFSRSSFIKVPVALVTSLLLGTTGQAALAASPVLIQGPKVVITEDDLKADSLRMPVEMRSKVLKRPQTVQQIGTNLYVRRVMAEEAKKLGLEKSVEIEALVQITRDKALSDAYLAHLEELNSISDEVALAQARTMYKARHEQFKVDDQVQASHILIAGTEAASRAQAEKIIEELKDGADFATLAKERSADKGSAAKGGDLGFFARGRMVPEFDEAAFALQKPGDLSGLVQSQFGYHIIKLDARKPAGIRPFDEVRDELVNQIRSKLQQDVRVAAAQKLQQGAKANSEAIEAFAASYGKDGKTAP